MKNKIIILGCGYIGTNLANYIINNTNSEVFVIGVYNEYVEYLNKRIIFVDKYIEQINEDDRKMFENAIVIDAVGNINATNDLGTSSSIFIQNCSSKISLINKIGSFNIKKFVFLSSGGTVYNDSEKPHKEEEKLDAQNIYALEKITIESYLKIKSYESDKFNYLILRLSNPFGGIVSKNKKQGIIDVVINKIYKNEAIELYGDIENIRDYIYIDVMSEYIYKLILLDYNNDVFNIGSGKGTSIKDLFICIENIFKRKIKYKIEKSKTCNIKCNILDMSKTNKYVRLEKEYELSEMLNLHKKTNVKEE